MTQLRDRLDQAPMTPFQWQAVAVCTMLIMIDGFDVLVMAFTASSVSAEWALSGKQLGLLFSAGLFGMAGGSLFLAPVADRIGRQRITLLCLLIVTAGMLASAAAQTHWQLALLRGMTGIGIGGMLASVGVIAAEYASARWRSSCVALQATGYPIGATLGGLAAAWLLTHYGWRSVFVFGGVISALMIPVVLWRLPESVDFLIACRPKGALAKLNRLLARMAQPQLAQLPAAAQASAIKGNTVAALFRGALAAKTVMIWAGFFLLMFSFYFSLSWTPKLLVAAGLSAQQGVTGGVLLNLGGIVGGSLFGALALRLRLAWLTTASLVVAAVFTAAFALTSASLGLAFGVAFFLGLFLFASMAGLYGLVPATYPPAVRVTGMGWAIGIGRAGAILSPMTAGVLLDGGWQPLALYYLFALPLAGAALLVLACGSGRTAPGIAPQRAVGAH